MTRPEREAVVRRALAKRRATGAPLLPLLFGLRGASAADGTTLLGAGPPEGWPLGVTGLATLADFALGAALRAGAGRRAVLPTLTLTVQLQRPGELTAAAIAARAEPHDGPLLCATGTIDADGNRIGSCLSTFGRAGGDAPPLPWERGDDRLGDEDSAEVAEVDQRAVDELLQADGVEPDWQTAETGSTRAELTASELHLNRAGRVQGGALFGWAAEAARAAARPRAIQLVAGHMAFLRAAAVGRIGAEARLDKSGRQVVFASVALSQDGAPVATASMLLAPAGDER